MIAEALPESGNGHLKPLTPGEIAEAITGKNYLSYSQISLFQACTLKWYFTYVEKAQPEMISSALLLGSSIHAAIQHYLECQMAAEKAPSVDQLMEVFQVTWKEEAKQIPVEYSREENADSQAALAKQMLAAFLSSPLSNSEGQTLGIEETLRVSLHPDLPDLVAKVDHLAGVNHELVVTDFKTTRSMWGSATAEEHADQLHLYAEAVKTIAEDLNVPVKLRFVILTKAKTTKVEAIEIKADPMKVQRSTMIIQNVFKAMQTGVVYPSPNTMNCSGCPFKKRCDNWHRENAP